MFKRMENFDGGEDEHRGRGGPIRITEAAKVTPFYDLVIQSAVNLGILEILIITVAIKKVSPWHKDRSTKAGVSTAVCYLEPARARPNLTIQSGAEAFAHHGRQTLRRHPISGPRRSREARVGREVIVSCGTINSPKLLELSGIGQPEILRQHGIDVVHALPGVGENLRDHYAVLLKYTITQRTSRSRISAMVGNSSGLRYMLFHKGFIAQSMGAARLFFRTREGLRVRCHDGAHSLYSNPGKWRAPHLPPAGVKHVRPHATHRKHRQPSHQIGPSGGGARDQLQLPG